MVFNQTIHMANGFTNQSILLKRDSKECYKNGSQFFGIATLGVLRGFGCFYWVQWIDHPGIHQIISPTLYSWGSPLLDPKNGQQNLTPDTLRFPNRNEGVANSKNTPDTQPPPGSYKRYTQEDFFVGPDHLKNTPERKG